MNRTKIQAAAECLARIGVPASGACLLLPNEWRNLGLLIGSPLTESERMKVCEALVMIERSVASKSVKIRAMAAGA